MFWADTLAQEIKKRGLSLEWVDDMKTPSGRVHVGALRGVIVHDLAFRALKDAGVNTKYTYVFEDHDPMDDIPSYLPRDKFEKYLGMPLFAIPSPEPGFKNYAEYYALEFQNVFNAIGSYPEIIWTKDLYTSGKMNEGIRKCLDKAGVIRQIYEEMYKKPLPSNWYPFQLYCPECGKVSTTQVTDWDGEKVTYECIVDKVKWAKGCGAKGKVSPFSTAEAMVGKLPWKVEWPVKWMAIGVTVEGAGKDHMSAGGSHDLAKLVCERVLNYPVPYPIPYEWFLVGGRKMSSSRGVGTSAKDVLEILPPELIRFLMVKTRYQQTIDFDPAGNTIPDLFDDYQRFAQAYLSKSDEDMARVFELSQVTNEIVQPPSIRFSVLAQWVQMPNMADAIKEQGLTEWAKYARIWIEKFAPDSDRFTIQKDLPETAKEMTLEQKEFLHSVADLVEVATDPDEFQKAIYEKSKEVGLSSKDAFGAIYSALLGKNSGPKAGWLILSLDKAFVQKRFRSI